jgi:NMD protein affecting ribosome stability and mRNA decay
MSHHAKGTRQHPIGSPLRGQGILTEREHDPYRDRGKPPEPSVCPDCQAVFHEGRWQWLAAPPGAHAQMCPACRRVRDRFPAGYLTLEGEFFREHRTEVMNLVQARARHVREEHPLQRLMEVQDREDGSCLVTTTDTHLARGLGEALRDAWRGELAFHYEKGQTLLRVHWRR